MKKTLVLTMAILLGGCVATDTASTTSSSQVANVQTEQFFEVHKGGRIYLFSDFDLYQDFMQLGHTAYFKAFIGEGPHGETLKFGLTGEQKKKLEGVKHVDYIKVSVKQQVLSMAKCSWKTATTYLARGQT